MFKTAGESKVFSKSCQHTLAEISETAKSSRRKHMHISMA